MSYQNKLCGSHINIDHIKASSEKNYNLQNVILFKDFTHHQKKGWASVNCLNTGSLVIILFLLGNNIMHLMAS